MPAGTGTIGPSPPRRPPSDHAPPPAAPALRPLPRRRTAAAGDLAVSASPTALPRKLALAYALLIAYACLHPLTGWRASGLPTFDYLFAPWPKYFILADLVFNVAGYVPFGFVLVAALPACWGAARRAGLAILCGGLLSFGLETAQHFLPARVASNIDIGGNLLGAALGALLGVRWGARVFASHGLLQRWRARAVIRGHSGDAGLILLGLWLLGQLSVSDLLFATGDLRSLLGIPPPLNFYPARFIAFDSALTVSSLLAVGLFARCMLRASAAGSILVLLLLGVGAKTLAGATFFEPAEPLSWLTPGAARGLMIGLPLLALALLLPRIVQHALAGTSLLVATALVNLIPENPYLMLGHRLSSYSNFLSFHGLTQLVDSLWPFLALGYLSALGLWRGEHLADERRL